jgi:hypothetical protein
MIYRHLIEYWVYLRLIEKRGFPANAVTMEALAIWEGACGGERLQPGDYTERFSTGYEPL